MKHKIYGTTIFIGEKKVQMNCGEFNSLVFQDIINKNYIIALQKFDSNTETLYTRIHSSCVTSEMFDSQDCDCVQQLEGAIQLISEKQGILFYLIQEGRGSGYIGKARACQMVQYNEYNDIDMTTFDAYKSLGMKKDYRSYHNIKEIMIMMDIYEKKFILLTNNPDKINNLKKLNVNVVDIYNIEFVPNQFNKSYLVSKEKTGHQLKKIKNDITSYLRLNPDETDSTLKTILPNQPIDIFEPYHIKEYKRFILCASYYLPIKLHNNRFVLSKKQIDFLTNKGTDFKTSKHFVELNPDIVQKYNIINPVWFQVNLYYDLTTNLDYILLKYKDPFCESENIPIVRVHSESIFDRFPLAERIYKNRYRHSINKIVENGCGYLLLFYRDGRGSGLGYYLLNQVNKKTGVYTDNRDYHAACQILKNVLQDQEFNMLYTNFSKYNIRNTTAKYNLNINKWIPILDSKTLTLTKRIFDLKDNFKNLVNFNEITFNKEKLYYVTGIGSSEYHAKYLVYLLSLKNYSYQFIDFNQLLHRKNINVILISQGMSPNTKIILKKSNLNDLIIFTSKNVKEYNTYPLFSDNPDSTLVRITGPALNFAALYKNIINKMPKINFNDIYNLSQRSKLTKYNYDTLRKTYFIFIADYPLVDFIGEIANKFMEILYCIAPKVIDYYQFSHGIFQSSLYHDNVKYLLFPSSLKNNAMEMLKKQNDSIINVPNFNNIDTEIINYEIYFSYVLDFILSNNYEINFTDWKGKNSQKCIYELV